MKQELWSRSLTSIMQELEELKLNGVTLSHNQINNALVVVAHQTELLRLALEEGERIQ